MKLLPLLVQMLQPEQTEPRTHTCRQRVRVEKNPEGENHQALAVKGERHPTGRWYKLVYDKDLPLNSRPIIEIIFTLTKSRQ